jgi:hypothetical protein
LYWKTVPTLPTAKTSVEAVPQTLRNSIVAGVVSVTHPEALIYFAVVVVVAALEAVPQALINDRPKIKVITEMNNFRMFYTPAVLSTILFSRIPV